MRVISNFKDYYDCIQAYGYDPKIVYHRVTEDLGKNITDRIWARITNSEKFLMFLPSANTIYSAYYKPQYYFHPFFVIVGGKVYTGYKLMISNQACFYWEKNVHSQIEYNYDKIHEFIAQYDDNQLKYLENNWERVAKLDLSDLCLEAKSPLLLLSRGSNQVIEKPVNLKDPFLKDYKFAKCLEPYKMYQQLSMFVGNVLIEPNKPVWPISDILKAENHGFNKFSFRKQGIKK